MLTFDSSLPQLLRQAIAHREALLADLKQQQTSCYRLFHGTAEGVPGLTIDRYGPQVLVQCFHQMLTQEQYREIRQTLEPLLDFSPLWVLNDRTGPGSRVQPAEDPLLEPDEAALEPLSAEEWGVRYRIQGRHRGHDPLLFLDLRNARRWVKEHAAGKRVLNLFAYTSGVGLCAAAGGAAEVLNVDFARSSLSVAEENARLNAFAPEQIAFLQSDFFAACRQLAGLPVGGRRGQRLPRFARLKPRQFDLVFLDPPRFAKSAFGTVDLERDYQSLMKPALLATAPGGQLICCNNVASVDYDQWLERLLRCAEKADRPVRAVERILPAEDFPSFDQRPPLKTVVLSV